MIRKLFILNIILVIPFFVACIILLGSATSTQDPIYLKTSIKVILVIGGFGGLFNIISNVLMVRYSNDIDKLEELKNYYDTEAKDYSESIKIIKSEIFEQFRKDWIQHKKSIKDEES